MYSRGSYLSEFEFQNLSDENRRRAIMQTQRTRATPSASALFHEARRQNYATTGEGPTRQSLYDWAVVPDAPVPTLPLPDSAALDDSDEDMDDMSTAASNTDVNARRDLQRLERALQTYRSARNALRSGGTPDAGPIPSANAALRAYWNAEAIENTDTSRRTPHPGSLWSQYRQERNRRTEQSRLEAENRTMIRSEAKGAQAVTRVWKLIRYLSQLRYTGVEGGLEAARVLGLDSLYVSEEANIPSDLPMHINSLPVPRPSSWLEPGMVWHGLQSTEREPTRTTPTWATSARRERQRDLFRRTLARRREMALGIPPHNEPDRPPADSLLDAERYISDLLQDGDGRWGFSQRSPSLSSHPTQPSQQAPESDHWPVKVTIHSVDYETMTLTGTMSASHMPDKLSPLHQSTSPAHPATTSMSSFFTGEIIDFRQRPLETEKNGRDYDVGGLEVDARYWARLGPFRKEIERVRSLRGKRRSEYLQDSRLWEAFRKAAGGDGDKEMQNVSGGRTPLNDNAASEGNVDINDTLSGPASAGTAENKEAEDAEIMARSLGSAKWMEEKLGAEWILMRWKERCFVNPSGTLTGSDSTRTILTTTNSSASTTTTTPLGDRSTGSNASGGTSWGLTILGFYYIALNRMTGEIDGLYYDPGSQPYQALRMVPEGMARSSEAGENGHPRGGCVCGCGEANCKQPVGLKRWFPSVEFR